jgi:hypothetical protein
MLSVSLLHDLFKAHATFDEAMCFNMFLKICSRDDGVAVLALLVAMSGKLMGIKCIFSNHVATIPANFSAMVFIDVFGEVIRWILKFLGVTFTTVPEAMELVKVPYRRCTLNLVISTNIWTAPTSMASREMPFKIG